MADEEKKEAAEEAEKAEKTEAGGSGSKLGGVVGIVLPALLAGAGAFGGSFLGGGPAPAAELPPEVVDTRTPGPTVSLAPFVLNVMDDDGASHAAKVTFAVELEREVDPATFEAFVPRIRDTILTYLRTMSFDEMRDGKSKVRVTEDLLAAVQKLGAADATHILIQDFVVQ